MKKISPVIGVLFRLQRILSEKAKKCIYFGLIQSHLLYMNVIWNTATATRTKPLQILQNRAVKILFKIHHRTSSEEVYASTGLLNIFKLSILTSASFGFHIIKGFWRSQTRFISNTEVFTVTKQGWRTDSIIGQLNHRNMASVVSTTESVRVIMTCLVKYWIAQLHHLSTTKLKPGPSQKKTTKIKLNIFT